MRIRCLWLIILVSTTPTSTRGEVTLIAGGRALGEVIVDSRGSQAVDARGMEDAANWLVDALNAASGVALPITQAGSARKGIPAIVLQLSDAPAAATVAAQLDLSREAYAVVTRNDQIAVIGRSGVGVCHGVAELLRHLGFRYFAPSPVWHHIPDLSRVSIDLTTADSPLREYYGVEAWDWGLPGRMRGSQVEYHRQWIPYYAKRNLDAINAETNANWGGQSLGLYIAAKLMWDPSRDTTADKEEFFALARPLGQSADSTINSTNRRNFAPPRWHRSSRTSSGRGY